MSDQANTDSGGQDTELARLLSAGIVDEKRLDFYDMDDGPEVDAGQTSGRLSDALKHLRNELYLAWRKADKDARQHQRIHRRLALTAISSGGLAIILAIVQLALKQSSEDMMHLAGKLELVSVAGALFAVVFGLWAKSNRHWIRYRNLAERLRNLKFRSLGFNELWCKGMDEWKQRVDEAVKDLCVNNSHADVENWMKTSYAGPDIIEPPSCTICSEEVKALAVYYKIKRLEFQRRYYSGRSHLLQRRMGQLPHMGLMLFSVSVLAVIIHFGAETAAGNIDHVANPTAVHAFEYLSVWGLAAAAIFPVIGFGVRAWLAAFEMPRSEVLFASKEVTMSRAGKELDRNSENLAGVLQLIELNEHSLENEHREWLILLVDAEWFL